MNIILLIVSVPVIIFSALIEFIQDPLMIVRQEYTEITILPIEKCWWRNVSGEYITLNPGEDLMEFLKDTTKFKRECRKLREKEEVITREMQKYIWEKDYYEKPKNLN